MSESVNKSYENCNCRGEVCTWRPLRNKFAMEASKMSRAAELYEHTLHLAHHGGHSLAPCVTEQGGRNTLTGANSHPIVARSLCD